MSGTGEQRRTSDPEIQTLFESPDCPWSKVMFAKGERVVDVPVFLAFAAEHLGGRTDMEEAVDAFVSGAGGRRERVLEPLVAPDRWLARLLRRTPPASTFAWTLPRSFFAN